VKITLPFKISIRIIPRDQRQEWLDEFDRWLSRYLVTDVESFRRDAHTWVAKKLKLI
jgi:hypothetical protein